MSQALDQFFSAGTVVLALTVVILTFFTRRIVETAKPSLKKKADENAAAMSYETHLARWYQQVILYAIPVVIGAMIGAFDVPYLFSVDGLETTTSRVFFGGVAGWLSSFLYKVVRMAIRKRTGIDLNPTPSIVPGDEPPGGS